MRILVIGGGGREHALVWALMRSSGLREVICAPGNAGIAGEARCVPVDAGDPAAVVQLARAVGAALTVVGPERPLARGVVDLFEAAGLRIVGPTAAAARLESSKVFAKAFMARHGIPTARFRVADSAADAHAVVASGELGLPVVVKADGLAAGKGVVVTPTAAAAGAAIDRMMVDRIFGAAGDRVVLEEHLSGDEVSMLVLTDGRHAVPLPAARDHKRLLTGDRGPNTGGMGAFAPVDLPPAMLNAIQLDIVEPTIAGMAAEGHPFRGVLYFGLMMTADGPRVLEYNVRFGDPEAQALLPLLGGDVAAWLMGTVRGGLPARIERQAGYAAAVVIATRGYPDAPETGIPIEGIEDAGSAGALVFHAGTRREKDMLVTAGGRVLNVVGLGSTLADAVATAYRGVSAIRIEGMQYRTDIAAGALGAHHDQPAEDRKQKTE